MPIRTNTWNLGGHYDLTNSGQNAYFGSTLLFAWGAGNGGPLGQNDTVHRSSPIQIPGTQWNSISTGSAGFSQFSLATKTDGTLWSWGYNASGRLGQNNRIDRSSPTQVPGTQWRSVECGQEGSLATKTDGTLWSWGYDNSGVLGVNSQGIPRSSPTQIPGTQWNSMSGGYRNSMATKTDGTLWSWGRNYYGELGQNNRTYYSSPRQIPGTQWDKIGAGTNCMFSTKTDGTLWAWGINIVGQLGQNNKTYYSSPTQIPGTQWNLVISGKGSTSGPAFGLKTDGTFWAWGQNASGQLGQNDTARRSSPTQIPGTQWSKIGSGPNYTVSTKTDGTLWSWGSGSYGKLAQNNAVQYSSPRQIPGTQWSLVDCNDYNVLATQIQ